MSDKPRDDGSWARRHEACNRFEDAWLAGQRPRIEDFLATVAQREREDLLRELLRLELFYRREKEETPAAEEYRARFPQAVDLIDSLFAREPWPTTAHGDQTGPDLSVSSDPETPVLPGYEIVEELGRGGMGVVYRVRDPDLQRELAIKVLLPRLHLSPEMVRHFIEEAQVTGQLQHPGVPPVHERGQLADGRPFFTMKLIQGQTLAALLKARGSPGEDQARFVGVFEQICQAVAYAHSRGVIHRDLKPANVMVGAFGEVQVMDWGLAKVLASGGTSVPRVGHTGVRSVRTETPGQWSQAGEVKGTLAFMAPEQARGETDKLDERCDVFGLGAILCVILTGRPPYLCKTQAEAHRQSSEGELTEAFTRLEGCGADAALVALAKSCLAADREQRPGNAAEVAKAVTGYRASVEERLRAAERERAAAQARAEEAKARQAAETLAREAAEAKVAETQAKVKAERRARRLFAGLATAVLLLGGAGLWWAWQRAEQKIDVTGQLEEVSGLLSEWKLVEARAAMERAEGRVAGNAPADLKRQVQEMRDNLTLVDRVDHIRLNAAVWVDDKFDDATADREYAELFQEQGLGDDSEDPDEVASRLEQRSAIKAQLLAALDDWAIRAQKEVRRGWLLEVVRRADPDPWRDRVRVPSVWRDRSALTRLAGEKSVAEQPQPFLFALGIRLKDLGGDSVPLLRMAQDRHPGDFWCNFYLGLILQARKKPEEAVGFYRAALALRPGTFAVLNNLANVLRRMGKVDEAIAAYRKAIESDPKQPWGHSNLGSALHDTGKVDEAIAEYRKAIQLDPKFAAPHDNLGRALVDKGKMYQAITEFRQAIELEPKNAKAHSNLGSALHDTGKVDEAIAEHRKAIQLDPNHAKAHYNLGSALYAKGKADEAITEYRKAIDLDPKLALAHYNLGYVLRRKGKVDEAIAAYRKAIQLDPKHALAHSNLGSALYAKGKVNEAINACRKAIELDPKQAKAHSNLGAILCDIKHNHEGAIVCFRKAIELDPKDAEAHANLGVALRAKGKVDEAIAEFRKAIELDPKFAPAHANLGAALGEKDKVDEAIAELRQAVELDPKFAPAHYNLGYVLRAKGKVDEAIAEFRKAVELDPKYAKRIIHGNPDETDATLRQLRAAVLRKPKDAGVHLQLGNAYYAKGRLDDACRCYRDAIKISPTFAVAHYSLGNALRGQGKLNEATACYREAIRLQKDFAEAHCNLGNIFHQQGRFDESLESYRRGHNLGSKRPNWNYPSADWVRNAERMVALEKKLSAILADEGKPTGGDERIELAKVATLKRLHWSAARLYSESFSDKRALMEDQRAGHCYAAATAAIRAASGEGKDSVRPDEKDCPGLRRQALDWLRTDLRAWEKQVGSNKSANTNIRLVLSRWQNDSALANVRDKEAIAKLPEAERTAWQKLWADAARVLKQAQEKPAKD